VNPAHPEGELPFRHHRPINDPVLKACYREALLMSVHFRDHHHDRARFVLIMAIPVAAVLLAVLLDH
jgi:hypothetical protein